MRPLRDDTQLILDGEVRVYRRANSKRWQAAFVIDGHTIRISTGKRILEEAKEYARDAFLEYKFRHKNQLPVVTVNLHSKLTQRDHLKMTHLRGSKAHRRAAPM